MANRMVFISYSHHDQQWRDRVSDHLKALSLDGRVDPWSDERIRTGSDWRAEIQDALTSASAAILIVTRHFLSSPFILKEEISELLRRRREDGLRMYAVIAEPCLWNKFKWLEGMQVVRIADLDKTQPTEYEIDQRLVRLVAEIDEAFAAAGEKAEAPIPSKPDTPGAGAKLTPAERSRQVLELLEQPAGDSVDGLPEGLLKIINDVGYVALLEAKLDPSSPPVVLKNAVRTIGLLADWEWDHREIKSPNTSLPKLTSLYRQVEDIDIRGDILYAISKFSPPEIPFEFLLERLAIDPPLLKANILSDLQFYVNRPYLAPLVEDKLLPLLHEFCRYPQTKAIYSDELHTEMDFRFWVFRCLGAIGSESSVPLIDEFIATNKWPLDALAEAANAHWDITRTPKYVAVLKKAKQQGVAGNTEHALKEIEKFLGVRSRSPAARKSKPGGMKAPVKRRKGPRTGGRQVR